MSKSHLLIPIVIVAAVSLIAGTATINNRVKRVDAICELKTQIVYGDTSRSP